MADRARVLVQTRTAFYVRPAVRLVAFAPLPATWKEWLGRKIVRRGVQVRTPGRPWTRVPERAGRLTPAAPRVRIGDELPP